MKTTLDLPDDLLRTVKIRAVQENRKLKDMVAELLRRGLAEHGGSPETEARVKLPLVECTRVDSADELAPDRVAEILLDQEVDALQPSGEPRSSDSAQ